MLGQFLHVREGAMTTQAKIYPIVESAINLFGDWLKHQREMRELRDMNSGDFARIARDLCVSPADSMRLSARDRMRAMSCRGF
jgi:hypothetical protein